MCRPTKYKPEYCKELIDFMSEGYSLEAFCGHIGIVKDTLYNWFKQHKDFSDAKKKALAKSLLWWEKQGIKAVSGENKDVNSTVWIFNMKNRHGWKDKQEVDQKIEANVNVKDLRASIIKDIAENK